MAFANVKSAAILGIDALAVSLEVNIDLLSLPSFTIVGLTSKEIDEAKERVRSAIKNSGFSFPQHKITVNLAPADISKKGSFYDLAIAVGILKAQGDIKTKIDDKFMFGELSLNGKLNYVAGSIPLIVFAKDKFNEVILPEENSFEGSIIENLNCYKANDLLSVVNHLNGVKTLEKNFYQTIDYNNNTYYDYDFKYIKGQRNVKRALEVAASGMHNISLVGPAGCGKTFLARSIPSILPSLSENEMLETTKIYSVMGLFSGRDSFNAVRPFRSPHHTISKVGLLGGGNPILPGEISMAHRGVLFLDEFAEFNKDIIESLRGPLEDKEIQIARSKRSVVFPSNFMFVAASNPCSCGNFGSLNKDCTCSVNSIKKYHEKLNGPVFDRVDMHIKVLPVAYDDLKFNVVKAESSKDVKQRVTNAVLIQKNRYKNDGIIYNSELKGKLLAKYCALDSECENLLESASRKFNLSARGVTRILKVSRTIADLDEKEKIIKEHLLEAISYRA